ncbi:MAG: phosphate ABC transporter substrate-binding protein, partial [Mesorhizobium sp.]
MSELIAALPMYDWPEARDEVDAQWASLREAFRPRGIDAPRSIVRRNADLPAVPGGIHDAQGGLIAPDPATLPPDELDFHKLWLHPALLFAQTCWGPMELGLSRHVQVVGQPSYDAYEGGQGELYSSALVMRSGEGPEVRSPADGKALLPLDLIRGKRFTFNSLD